MVAIKIFRVEGEIHSPNYHTTFSKDLRAVRTEDAIEKVLMEFGGRHNVKRVHVNITAIQEIS